MTLIVGCTERFLSIEAQPFGGVSIAAGEGHTLIATDVDVYGAGSNASQQLAGDEPVLAQPVRIPLPAAPRSVHAGYAHSCFVDVDGAMWCWGGNDRGQLGTGDREPRREPTRVALATQVVAASVAFHVSCALLTDRQAFCWGYNEENALAQRPLFEDVLTPVAMIHDGDSTWSAIAAGQGHVCGIDTSGGLWCAGRNSSNELGLGPDAGIQAASMRRVGADSDWRSVVCGQSHTCGTRSSEPGVAGEVWCWGGNRTGQLGVDVETTSDIPRRIDAPELNALATNTFATYGIDGDGAVWSWGRNVEGQLGVGEADEGPRSPAVTLNKAARFIAAGRFHVCTVTNDGELLCTGANSSGQLGLGDTLERRSWTEIIPR